MAVAYLRPIRLGNLSVSYGIEYGECEICRICCSEEGCSSVASFWQGKDEDVLKLLLLLAIYGGDNFFQYNNHPKCVIPYRADLNHWDWQAAGGNMRVYISYDIFPK